MTFREIASQRLLSQQIGLTTLRTPAEVVAALGAMQAQDYTGSLWSVGARLPGITEAEVEAAIADRSIVRTWPMRGTLHLVAAADVRWLLKLLTPRIVAGAETRRRQLELDDATFLRCEKHFVRALSGGRQLSREALFQVLEQEGIPTGPHRGYHIIWRLAQEGVLCGAAREGKEQTFALLEEWVPKGRNFEGDEALAELAARYFTSHGPATLLDFSGWAGLRISDARRGVELASARLVQETIDGKGYWMGANAPKLPGKLERAHLLAGFDEYLLGYKDRSPALAAKHASKIVPGSNGVFLPTIVIDGQVVGTWKRTVRKSSVVVMSQPFAPFTKVQARALAEAAARYGNFLQMPVAV